MPTGYTDALMKKNYDVKKWLMEDVIRAMGVSVLFRDNGEMSIDEMREGLKNNDSYNMKRLSESNLELEAKKSWTDDKWIEAFEAEKIKNDEYNTTQIAKHDLGLRGHTGALQQLHSLAKDAPLNTHDDIVINTLKFAIEQVESGMKFDYGHGPFLQKSEESWERYRDVKIKEICDSIIYNTKSLAEEQERCSNRLAAFDAFVKFVEEN